MFFISKFINYLDDKKDNKTRNIINQAIPIVICLILFAIFILITYFIIHRILNPVSSQNILIRLYPVDVMVGFFLYFVTAIDYALIVGRMQVANTGAKARIIMNVFTCIGCFVGVTLVLFLWGFAKELPWLIIPLLIFAGSVMIKLAYEGCDYFAEAKTIHKSIRTFTLTLLRIMYYPARVLTFWIPELGSPNVSKMSNKSLMMWSFFLPFIIGTDDLVGYMGAMTIYNAFSLVFGIYLADIVIDILIFVSPSFTKKLVQNPFPWTCRGICVCIPCI